MINYWLFGETLRQLLPCSFQLYHHDELKFSHDISSLPRNVEESNDYITRKLLEVQDSPTYTYYIPNTNIAFFGSKKNGTSILIGPYLDDEKIVQKPDFKLEEFESFLPSISTKQIAVFNDLFRMNYIYSNIDNLEVFEKESSDVPIIEVEDDTDKILETYESERILLDAISSGDYKKLKDNMIFRGNTGTIKRARHDTMRNERIMCIIANTLSTRACIKGGVDTVVASRYSQRIGVRIELCTTIVEIQKLRNELFQTYAKLVNEHKRNSKNPLVTAAITEIDRNIYSKITLDIVAKKLFVSPEHLSRKFVKVLDISFTNFVKARKVEEAKELLKRQYYVSEIAMQLGFSSTSHFIKVFKTECGMTPNKYRESLN